MMNWILLIELYILSLVGAIIHEFGHFGKIKIHPIPFLSYAENPKIGGFFAMIPEGIVLILIAYFNPSFILLQYLGFILWIHFTASTILGGLGLFGKNQDNYRNIFAIIIGIIILIYSWSYYFPIGLEILNKFFI